MLRIAGAVQNTASFRPGSSVSRQCDRYESHTSVAPIIAPANSPTKYLGTSLHSVLPITANPNVTAGLRCAPLNCPTAKTPTITPIAQPQVITIQPEFSALDLLSRTAATTPSPNRIRSAVPIASAPKMLKSFLLLTSSSCRPERVGTLPFSGRAQANAFAAVSSSMWVEVAPGSWWPTLRGPR